MQRFGGAEKKGKEGKRLWLSNTAFLRDGRPRRAFRAACLLREQQTSLSSSPQSRMVGTASCWSAAGTRTTLWGRAQDHSAQAQAQNSHTGVGIPTITQGPPPLNLGTHPSHLVSDGRVEVISGWPIHLLVTLQTRGWGARKLKVLLIQVSNRSCPLTVIPGLEMEYPRLKKTKQNKTQRFPRTFLTVSKSRNLRFCSFQHLTVHCSSSAALSTPISGTPPA